MCEWLAREKEICVEVSLGPCQFNFQANFVHREVMDKVHKKVQLKGKEFKLVSIRLQL